MKQLTSRKLQARKLLSLNRETVRALRVLTPTELAQAQGGMMHTSFSCGRDLCTTHGP